MERFTRLFELLPLDSAMETLLAPTPRQGEAHDWVAKITETPLVQAALWLYVDDLDAAHELVQSRETPTGSYLHAILHRREGDFWNSKYWFSRAGQGFVAGFDPRTFVDQVAAADGQNPTNLVQQQRAEWKAVFEYVVKEGA